MHTCTRVCALVCEHALCSHTRVLLTCCCRGRPALGLLLGCGAGLGRALGLPPCWLSLPHELQAATALPTSLCKSCRGVGWKDEWDDHFLLPHICLHRAWAAWAL